jgi:alanyl-tRNA synthetase
MRTNELREKYLAFFESKGCLRKPSDVLVPRDDQSVLFTPAGMNQFKNQFLGIGPLEFTKATTCQKCLRTGDIENVGVTAYHHTFFEMLGNFSFGDYFKREAIHWAWEFLTSKKWLGLTPEYLTVTVYRDDDEAFGIWNNEIKLPANRIRREDEGENFWPASAPSQGPDGVCGPCSEIYYLAPGMRKEVEIWNLVFTQFNRVGNPPNNLQPLPKKNIDTGMGLERTAAVLQGVDSNFENDCLKPLCLTAAGAVGVDYSYDAACGRAIRRIADHVRAVTFCVHENVVPANEKQGYIVRQLLRRAFLEGYLLGQREPFLHTIVPGVAEVMRVPYPEVTETVERVALVIKAEEEQFLRTVERGLRKLTSATEKARGTRGTVSGAEAFDLHQTDGFLIELTEAYAVREGLTVDRAEFNRLMDKHREDSGRGAFDASVMKAGPLDALRTKSSGTEFLGYDALSAEAKVAGILAGEVLVDALSAGGDDVVTVVLDRTPFYGESGGQVGDSGVLTGADGLRFVVTDTQKNAGLFLHTGTLAAGVLKTGATVRAEVNADRRAGIRRAHSATHLLHHALQTTLGSHATQRGSKVDADLLRFDFTQPKAISREDLRTIEDRINARIAEAAPVVTAVMSIDAAKQAGATALFGEKYGDSVRVVTMGEFSKELCGGTHLTNTSQVGLCKVVAEESVAAGTRRITALTGLKALDKVRADEDLLVEIAQAVKAPRVEDIVQRVSLLQEELTKTKQSLSKLEAKSAAGLTDELLAAAKTIEGVTLVAATDDGWDVDRMRTQIDQLRKKATGPIAVLLGSGAEGKVLLMAALSADLVAKGWSSVELVKHCGKAVQGGGGGRPDLAQAGGKKPEGLPQALLDAAGWVEGKVKG